MNALLRRDGKFYALLGAIVFVLIGADAMLLRSPASTTPPSSEPSASSATAPAPLPSSSCTYNPQLPEMADYASIVDMRDPMKGNPDAKVTVIEFFEPNCPHCATLHPIMEEVARLHGDKARFIYKPVVFWPISLLQTQALYGAAQEGKFFDMLRLQFERQKQEGFNEAEVRQMATEIGMNADALIAKINAGTYRQHLNAQRAAFQQTGSNSVPIVLINGRAISSSAKTVACLGQMITEAAAG